MGGRRRDLLKAAGAGLASIAALPRPAIAQGVKELRMVTDWRRDQPGFGISAARLAESITATSEGRLRVTVYPIDTLVRGFETFDAVAAGAVEMYHSTDNYFGSKSPALNFFSAVPYGMTAGELNAWIAFGGGQALWDEIDAQFNIKPLSCSNTGVQMGGWFTREVARPEDLKGLRYRMPGLGAEVLRRMGATVVTTPGSEIITALKSGAIDASEWVGPWLDMALGLHEAAEYYYYPAFHEPGTGVTLGINKSVWDRFSNAERTLIETAAAAELTRSLAEYTAENIRALRLLRSDPRIKFRRFNDALIKTFGAISQQVVADTAAQDPLTRKVAESYLAFRAGMLDWTGLSERAYLEARDLALR